MDWRKVQNGFTYSLDALYPDSYWGGAKLTGGVFAKEVLVTEAAADFFQLEAGEEEYAL